MLNGISTFFQPEPAAAVKVADFVYGESFRSRTNVVNPRSSGALTALIQKTASAVSPCAAVPVVKQRWRMSQALADFETSPVLRSRADETGMPLTATVAAIRPPSD